MSVVPTEEQQAIIDAYVKGDNVVVQAFAGTGKTSTICIAAESVERAGLYLAFNKSIAQEVDGKLPDYIESRTTHSLAYKSVGHKYRNKLSRPKGRYVNVAGTPSEIVRYFKVKPFMDVSDLEVAKLAKLTVNKYESSDDTHIEKHHIPNSILKDIVKRADKRDEQASATDMKGLTDHVVKYAKTLWKERIDTSSDVLAMHDTYLKLFQLSKPDLDVDVVFLDECQDITPCVYDIVKQQEHKSQIVAVGDKFQSIYQWRGAVNAMEMFTYNQYTLSQSFRFGQAIADVANSILAGASHIHLKGNPNTLSRVAPIDTDNSITILSRTNTGVLMNALSYIDKGIPVDIKINVNDFCRILSEAQMLFDGESNKVKHEELVGFQSWKELLDEAEEDGGLKRIAQIVMQGRAKKVIWSLKNNDAKDAEVICITAHKSKGLEWDHVRLDDDFLDVEANLPAMERNLLYVAATRAMHTLELNENLNNVFNRDNDTWNEPRADMANFMNEQEEMRQMNQDFDNQEGEYDNSFTNLLS